MQKTAAESSSENKPYSKKLSKSFGGVKIAYFRLAREQKPLLLKAGTLLNRTEIPAEANRLDHRKWVLFMPPHGAPT